MKTVIRVGKQYDNGERIVVVEYINREFGEADIVISATRNTRKEHSIGAHETMDIEDLENEYQPFAV